MLWEISGENKSRKNEKGMGSLYLLQGIFPTQEFEAWTPAWQADFYQLSYQGSPPYGSVQSVHFLSHVLLGFPVHHQLPELTQTHVHWVGKAIQPSHLLSSPSSPILNLSQHQGLFQWVSSLHQVAKVLEPQLQHQSFQRIFRADFL